MSHSGLSNPRPGTRPSPPLPLSSSGWPGWKTALRVARAHRFHLLGRSSSCPFEGNTCFQGSRSDPRDTSTGICGEGGDGAGRRSGCGKMPRIPHHRGPLKSVPAPLPASFGCSLSPDSSPWSPPPPAPGAAAAPPW